MKHIPEAFRNDCMKRYMKMADVMTQQKSNRQVTLLMHWLIMKKGMSCGQYKIEQGGLKEESFKKMVQNARDTMEGLFTLDPRPLTDDEVLNIYRQSYK